MRDAHRPVPSAGALYPLVVHVVVRTPLGPLAPGLWWYDPAREPVVFISADLGRPARKYANRAYRYALIEVGAALQNGHLVCTELGVPMRAIGGLRDRDAHEFLELGDDVEPVLAVLLGA